MTLPLATGLQAAIDVAQRARENGQRVVFVNGCFDLLHPGHLQVFFQAKSFGDCLIVALNSDASIQRLKGPSRPILHEEVRQTMVAALKPVDAAFCFDEDNAANALRHIRPHLYAKGAQYKGKPYPESNAAEECEVELVYLDHVDGFSTSSIVDKIQKLSADQ